MRLAGKVAVVGAAGGGMGVAVPLLFAQEGAKVVVAARRPEPLADIVTKIKRAGGEASFVTADLTTEEGAQALADHAERTYGKLDIWYNNMGDAAGRGLKLHETPLTDWNYLTDINLKAAYVATRAGIPAFQRNGRGVLIHVSASFDVRQKGHAGYAAAKAGLLGMVQNTSRAYKADNIRVVCICPQSIGTQWEGDRVDMPAPNLDRRGTPTDVAWAALFLASDEASWLTGLVVPVDGGNELLVP